MIRPDSHKYIIDLDDLPLVLKYPHETLPLHAAAKPR